MLSGDISLGTTFFRSLGIRDGALSFVMFVSVYLYRVYVEVNVSCEKRRECHDVKY